MHCAAFFLSQYYRCHFTMSLCKASTYLGQNVGGKFRRIYSGKI